MFGILRSRGPIYIYICKGPKRGKNGKNYHILFILFTKPAKDITVYFVISYENISLTYTDKNYGNRSLTSPDIGCKRVQKG